MKPGCIYTYEGKQYSHDEFKQLMAENQELFTKYIGGKWVPNAPFKSTWHEMVFRRMLKQAVEEGKDWLGWTTGEQQAERYNLSKQLESITFKRDSDDYFHINAMPKGRSSATDMLRHTVEKAELPDVVGQEMAARIVADTADNTKDWLTYRGLDLKIGGEGMNGFYDKILVDYANKFGKKFGSQVEDKQIDSAERANNVQVKEMPQGHYDLWRDGIQLATGLTRAEANLRARQLNDKVVMPKIHALPITDSMRKSLGEEGVALFSPKQKKFVDASSEKSKTGDMTTYNLKRDGTTGWLLPSGQFVGKVAGQNLGDIHNGLLSANPDWATRWKFDTKGDARVNALKAGLVRVREDGGVLHTEAAADRWTPAKRAKIEEMLDANGFARVAEVSLLNAKQKVVRSIEIPKSAPSQASPPQITPPTKARGAELKNEKGWVDPEGNFYPLDGVPHELWARQALGGDLEKEKASEELYKKGWLRVVPYGSNAVMSNADGQQPTTKQKRTLTDLAQLEGLQSYYHDNGSKSSVVWSQNDYSPAQKLDDKVVTRAASRISAITKAKGGISFNIAQNKNLGDQPVYAVSIYPERGQQLEQNEVTPDAVKKFIAANADLLADKNNSVGTWFDPESKKVYLDVSYTTPDKTLAVFAGKKYNQKTIWDMKKSEAIDTGGSGERVGAPGPAETRLADLLKAYKAETVDHDAAIKELAAKRDIKGVFTYARKNGVKVGNLLREIAK